MKTVQGIFSQQELDSIKQLSQVSIAYERLSKENSVYFTIPATKLIKDRLAEAFGLDLQSVRHIPCRWIKGDTPAHIDRGQRSFDDTYLVYLTDGEGEFHIGDESYPIQAGTGFSFPEGISHEVVNTNRSSRLLLGPMSEFGFPVGVSGIEGPGGSIAYIRNNSGTAEYSFDQENWNTVPFPCAINNSDLSSGILKIYFVNNLEFSNNNDYFYLNSDNIQIGNESLDQNGSPTSITISVDNYDGLIQNGTAIANGKNNIYIYNLSIDGNGYTTQIGGAWLGQKYFGKGATNNYIINCSSSGDINGGGILGDYAENVTLLRCSSRGEIFDQAGGIVGREVVSVVIESCWSTGAISGNGAGGILGANSISADISKCYSEGIISGANAGGIVGGNAGSGTAGVSVSKCYSQGAITGGNAGGICGSLATGTDTLSVSILNCYTTGNLNNTGSNYNGAICGLLVTFSSGAINLTITNCYTTGTVVTSNGYMIGNRTTINGSNLSNPVFILSNNYSEAGSSGGSAGSWNTTNANNSLTGNPTSFPGVGSVWASLVASQAYELANFGITPYTTQVIQGNALVQSISQSIVQGDSTVEGISADASGNAFAILQITGGTTASYSTIIISQQRGSISTTTATTAGTYTLYVRSTGSYNITTFVLTVTEYIPPSASTTACCSSTMDERGLPYEWINDYKIGNRLILEHSQNPNLKFNGYSEYVKYKMAQGSRK